MKASKLVKRPFYKKDVPAGSAIYIGDTEPFPTQLTITYQDASQQYIQREIALENLSSVLSEQAKQVVWLNVSGLKNTEVIYQLGQTLAIHALVIEDLLNTEHVSKVEFLSDYLFMITKFPVCTTGNDALKIEQLSLIVKDNLLITFQEEDATIFSTIQRKIKEYSVGQIVYGIIDTIIDDHYVSVEYKGNLLEALEAKLINNQLDIDLGQLYAIKRDLLRLRKNTLILQNIVTQLIREKSHFLASLNDIYLHDLHDHLLRIAEAIDIHYELSANILQVYLSSISNKTNETMKVLTLFAATFIPLSFIASLYGMNFTYIPGTEWKWGYFAAVGGMTALGCGLFMFFRKKGWV